MDSNCNGDSEPEKIVFSFLFLFSSVHLFAGRTEQENVEGLF